MYLKGRYFAPLSTLEALFVSVCAPSRLPMVPEAPQESSPEQLGFQKAPKLMKKHSLGGSLNCLFTPLQTSGATLACSDAFGTPFFTVYLH